MPLAVKLDSLDELPEQLHDLYEKGDDGKFHLTPPEGFVSADEIEDTSGLKSALQKEREAARENAKKLKAVQEKYAGFDLEEYNKLKDAEKSAEQRKLEEAGEFEKIKEQMREQHTADLAQKDQEIARLRGELEREKIDSKVVEAISKAEGNVELLKPHVRSRLQLDTDTLDMVVLDSDGKTPKVDGDGNPVTIEALVGEMRDQPTFAGAFKATDQSGTGSDPQKGGDTKANGANGGTPPAGDQSRSKMTELQKVEFIKEHGVDALMSLPD